MDEAGEEWIDALKSLRQVERLTGDRLAAKRTLAEYLRDGELRSKAASVWISEAPTIGKAWKVDVERIDLKTDVEIPAAYWRSSKLWASDQDHWRWPYGKFAVTIRRKPLRRRMLNKVAFSAADLDKILKRRVLSKGGAPTKDPEWTAFWHAVIDLAQSDRLNFAQFPTKASLRREILIEINESLSEKTIKPAVRQVYEKFIKQA